VVSLLEQVASDKAMIEFLEKAAADGGGNTVELQKEVHRLQSENLKARLPLEEALRACKAELVKQLDETNDVKSRLESYRTDAQSLKATADDLDVKLAAANKLKIVVLAQNEELKRELDTLRVSPRSNEPMESENKNLTSLLEKSKQDLLDMNDLKEELQRQLAEKNDEVVSTSQESQTARDQLLGEFNALMLVKTQLQTHFDDLQESYNELEQEGEKAKIRNELLEKEVLDIRGELDASKRKALQMKDQAVPPLPLEVLLLPESEEEEEAEVDDDPVADIPISVAFLDNPVVAVANDPLPVPNVVAFISNAPNDANTIFDYLKINVYVNKNPAATNFLSQFSTNGKGKLLKRKSFEMLINRLRNEPLEIFHPTDTYSTPLKDYVYWGSNSEISYEKIAKEYLDLPDA
jgi:hypothetical protein